jgi:hypothetical protein
MGTQRVFTSKYCGSPLESLIRSKQSSTSATARGRALWKMSNVDFSNIDLQITALEFNVAKPYKCNIRGTI